MKTTLYKIDTLGKVRMWEIEIASTGYSYRTRTGLLNGEKIVSQWTTVKEQNVGKSNHRDLKQQCLFKVNSLIESKNKEGYVESIEKASVTETRFSPMKAYPFDENKISFMCFSQPKLDGIRAYFVNGKLYTYNGNEIVSCPHIVHELCLFYGRTNKNLIIDGELYNHSLKNNFNKIVSIVKKTKPNEDDLHASLLNVQFHVFDMFNKEKPEMLFSDRYRSIIGLKDSAFLYPVDTRTIYDRKSLDSIYEHYLDLGYEGQMVRLNKPYEQKRSRTIYKRKEFVDAEYTVTNIVEGVGNRSGQAGYVECLIEKEKSVTNFRAGIAGDEDFRKDLLFNRDKYIGKMATIKHFKQLTPDGKPRFPVFKSIRDYE